MTGEDASEEAIGELSDDAIAGSWRIWQRVRGHRYSLDDVATAWEAAQVGAAMPGGARRVLDLGCGIGSVTLMLAYALREARIVGVEAQAISIELARRNVARNALGGRVELLHGDLREVVLDGRFDLVTGTPPYFDPAKSSPSTDAQRTHARIEMRGGIEDYLRAGARWLAPGGRMAVCGDARRPDRVHAGAASAGLVALARRDVVPREGKSALFAIWTLAREDAPRVELEEHAALIARDAGGGRTAQAHALRRFFDLPVDEAEAASPPQRERRAR